METKIDKSKKEKVKTIYNMQLHEDLWIENLNLNIMRVAGGWIYCYRFGRTQMNSVFIPYHKEFEWNELRKVDKKLFMY